MCIFLGPPLVSSLCCLVPCAYCAPLPFDLIPHHTFPSIPSTFYLLPDPLPVPYRHWCALPVVLLPYWCAFPPLPHTLLYIKHCVAFLPHHAACALCPTPFPFLCLPPCLSMGPSVCPVCIWVHCVPAYISFSSHSHIHSSSSPLSHMHMLFSIYDNNKDIPLFQMEQEKGLGGRQDSDDKMT